LSACSPDLTVTQADQIGGILIEQVRDLQHNLSGTMPG
jgi:hypothetical protein